MAVRPLLRLKPGKTARAAIFLSGSGSNAEQLLRRHRREAAPGFAIAALVTDRPDTSRARELGATYDVPVIEHDIRRFYHDRGCPRITIATDAGRAIRQQWTDALRQQLVPLDVDFGLFAGFVPLTNLADSLPCLNVHPGDLTCLKAGERYLVGLHTVPIERAILEGLPYLRSSVILVEPYTGKGDDMDNGLLLGLSPQVPVDLQGATLTELRQLAAARPAARPAGGYRDRLEQIAVINQERLKVGGDWVVFPRVAWEFAAGRYAIDDDGQLLYREEQTWRPVETIVFTEDSHEAILRE